MNTRKKSGSILLLLLPFIFFSACRQTEKEHHHSVQHEQIDVAVQIASPNKQVLSRQSTVKLKEQTGEQTLKAQGYIDIDKTRNQSVSARFGGRIEKLFVKYELQFINKGDKILELYSPELNTFQEEHLFLLKFKGETTLLEQSRQKLKLLGITDNQISLLEKNGTFTQAISIYSPASGYVLFGAESRNYGAADSQQQTSMTNMNMETKNNSGKTFSSAGSQIREGKYVRKGETLFSVNDLQNVWVIVSVSSEFQSAMQNSSQVKVSSELFPDKPLSGKIVLTEQTFEDNKQRFIRVRIDLQNSKNELKINSLVTAEIPLETNNNFQIPASAVYRTGVSSFVWVKTGSIENGTGIFQLRKVITGSAANGMVTVIKGLSASEEIAEHAGYLTDSETFLNEN